MLRSESNFGNTFGYARRSKPTGGPHREHMLDDDEFMDIELKEIAGNQLSTRRRDEDDGI